MHHNRQTDWSSHNTRPRTKKQALREIKSIETAANKRNARTDCGLKESDNPLLSLSVDLYK